MGRSQEGSILCHLKVQRDCPEVGLVAEECQHRVMPARAAPAWPDLDLHHDDHCVTIRA